MYAYTRALGEDRALVVLNWSPETARFDADVGTAGATVLCSNYDDPPADPLGSDFPPYEAVVYDLSDG